MTQAPVQLAPLTFGTLLAMIDAPSRRQYVLREIAKQGGQDFVVKRKAAIEGLGLTKEKPIKRLITYLNDFDDARWTELLVKFPRRHDELWADFQRLKARAVSGDFAPSDDEEFGA